MKEDFSTNPQHDNSPEKKLSEENTDNIKPQLKRRGAILLEAHEADEVNDERSALKTRVASFLRRHGRMLSFFAKDSTLRFEPSEADETFAFDAENFTVRVPLTWFADEKYTEDELQFANYHELSHFKDMRKNPEAYLENFEQIKKDADVLARKYCLSHPEITDEESVKRFYYNELHTLYNCLDDIYVNQVVADKNPYFDEENDGAKSITTLYEKIGFKEPDLTNMPLHRQMVFSLLRDEMIGKTNGESVVDERVKEVLSKKMLGKNMRELIESELKPKLGVLVDPAERYKIIRTLIQPKYLELLEVALKEKDAENKAKQNETENRDNSNSQETDNNKSQDNGANQESRNKFDPFGDSDNDSKPKDLLDKGENGEEEVRKILESFAEDDKVKNMSPEERAEYQKRKRIEKFDKKHGISEAERKENERIKLSIGKARREMRKFWGNLIGKAIQYRTRREHFQRRGRFNVHDFVHKYPEIIESQENGTLGDLNIYERNNLERVVVDQPEKIEVTLLVDCSGSMSGKRENAAKQAAALLMYSLKDFNDELERTRHQTQTKLKVDSQIFAFGSDYEEIKTFDTDKGSSVRDRDIIKSISGIDSNRGGTDDAAPLEKIEQSITRDKLEKIKAKKLKKIVFEITDGQPQSPEKTKEKIKKLEEEGVIVVGFQIGNVSESEKETFKEIWGEGSESRGIYIGDDISSLPKKLMDALSDLLRDVAI